MCRPRRQEALLVCWRLVLANMAHGVYPQSWANAVISLPAVVVTHGATGFRKSLLRDRLGQEGSCE